MKEKYYTGLNPFMFTYADGGIPSSSLFDEECWKRIYVKLATGIGARDERLSPNLGVLRFLRSETNRNAQRIRLGDAEKLNRNDGKMYRLKRRFYPRQASNVHYNQSRIYCKVEGETKPYIEDEVYIKYDHVSEPLILDEAMLRCIREGKQQWQDDRIREHLRTFMNDFGVKVAKRVADLSNGFVGSFAGENMPIKRDLPLYKTDGTLNPVGLVMLEEYAKQSQLNERPAMIGGTLLDMFTEVSKYVNADCSGFTVKQGQFNNTVFRDTNIGQHLGDTDCILAVAPGALQLVTVNRHDGDFSHTTDTQRRYTMVDPFTGIKLDVIYNMDTCESDIRHSLQFAICWDVIGYPKCWSDDPCFKYVTDVFLYRVVCADTKVCDIKRDTVCVTDLPLENHPFKCETGYVQCVEKCQGVFTMEQGKKCYFEFSDAFDSVNKIAVLEWASIQTTLPNAPMGGFDVSDPAQLTAMQDSINSVLGMNGEVVKLIYDGANLSISVEGNCSIPEMRLLASGSLDELAALAKSEKDVICFDSTMSAPTTGGAIVGLTWTLGSSTTTIPADTAPEAMLNGNGIYGCAAKFCLDLSLLADKDEIELTVKDNTGCESTYTNVVNFP